MAASDRNNVLTRPHEALLNNSALRHHIVENYSAKLNDDASCHYQVRNQRIQNAMIQRNEKMKNTLPELTINIEKGHNSKLRAGEDEQGGFCEEIWSKQLEKYLYTTLLPVIEPDPELRKEYIGEAAMLIWKIAFTSDSFDPTPGNNYELLEKFGDSAMKIPFQWMLLQKYPTMTHSQLSPLTQFYLSKPEQAKECVKLGLDRFVRSYYKNNIHTQEDILESFFGAIFFISTNIIREVVDEHGRSYDKAAYNCRKMIEHIYSNLDIGNNINIAGGPEINVFKETFEKMKWRSVNINVFKEIEDTGKDIKTGLTYFVIKFNDAFFNWLELYNLNAKKNGKNPIKIEQTKQYPNIVRVLANTKKVAKAKAYGLALAFLNEKGLSWDFADKYSLISAGAENNNYLNKAINKAKSEGFIDIQFSKDKKTEDGRYIQLIGIYPSESEDEMPASEVLVTIDGTLTLEKYNKDLKVFTPQMQMAALKCYLKFGKHPTAIIYDKACKL